MATFIRIAENEVVNVDDLGDALFFEGGLDEDSGKMIPPTLYLSWRTGKEVRLRSPSYDIEGIWEALMRLVLPSRDVPEMARREARREPTEAERIAMCKGA